MSKHIKFAVSAKSFELYKKFKLLAEQAGWVYNEHFASFTPAEYQNNGCLFFHSNWSKDGVPRFSLSNDDVSIPLETNWDKAVIMLGSTSAHFERLGSENAKLRAKLRAIKALLK